MPTSLLFPHLTIPSAHPAPSSPRPLAKKEPTIFGGKRQPQQQRELSLTTTRALKREWKEYEEAVKDKDLARALRFLKDIQPENYSPVDDESTRSRKGGGGGQLSSGWVVGWERDWEVLDACLNADDMRLVATTYSFLKDRGFLPNFGKCRKICTHPTHNQWLFNDLVICAKYALFFMSHLFNVDLAIRVNCSITGKCVFSVRFPIGPVQLSRKDGKG